ncbi:MAG: hypothetical protein WD669_07045 [Pirellulales bacterium]
MLMVIVSLLVVVAVQSWRLWKAEIELAQLRDETGKLTVDDRSKVHVIEVESDEPNTWKWRLFVPMGARYSWNLGYDEIPPEGLPRAKMSGASNESYDEADKEVLITASLRQLESGDWILSVGSKIGNSQAQMGGASVKIPNVAMEWTRKVPSREGSVLGARGVETLNPGEPIVLLKWRSGEQKPDGLFGPSASPMPGYMIWMQPE